MAVDFSTLATAALPHFYSGFGGPITYSRDGADSASITAIHGSQGVDVVDESGAYTKITREDFTLKKADLVVSGSTIVPKRGDTITDADANEYDVTDEAQDLHETDEWIIPVHKVDD